MLGPLWLCVSYSLQETNHNLLDLIIYLYFVFFLLITISQLKMEPWYYCDEWKLNEHKTIFVYFIIKTIRNQILCLQSRDLTKERAVALKNAIKCNNLLVSCQKMKGKVSDLKQKQNINIFYYYVNVIISYTNNIF